MAEAPKIVVKGVGTFKHPDLTAAELAAIRVRADAVSDQQLKTDLFRLLVEVDRLRMGK